MDYRMHDPTSQILTLTAAHIKAIEELKSDETPCIELSEYVNSFNLTFRTCL